MENRAPANIDQIQLQIVGELTQLFPASTGAKLLRARVVTERAATFSPVPGVDRWRPNQTSPIGNLFLAGDWTATGWPGTMEGAVRSGYLAAEALMERIGSKEKAPFSRGACPSRSKLRG